MTVPKFLDENFLSIHSICIGMKNVPDFSRVNLRAVVKFHFYEGFKEMYHPYKIVFFTDVDTVLTTWSFTKDEVDMYNKVKAYIK